MRLERGCVRLSNKLHGGQTHEVETNFNITRPILDPGTDMLWPEIKISETDILDVQLLLSDAQIERFAIFHTGARDLNRRWSAAKFAQLAEWLYTEYDVQVVFGGGPGEYADIEAIRKNCKVPTHNFAGRTSLTSFAALCRKSVLFVGNESGPMHIANVMNTPVVALFGPGVKGVFYPYGQNVRVIHHVPESNKDAATSMQKISLEEVQLAISELLNQ